MRPCARPLILLTLLAAFSVRAQDAPAPPPPVAATETKPAEPELPDKLRTLRDLLESRESLLQRIEELRPSLRPGAMEAIREQAKKDTENLQAQRLEIERDVERVTAGQTGEDFGSESAGKVDFGAEFGDLARPALEALKSATARPRQLEELRSALEIARAKEAEAGRIVTRLERLLEQVPKGAKHEPLRKALQAQLEARRTRGQEAQNKMLVLLDQQRELLARQEPVWTVVARAFNNFFLIRGRNLLLAAFAALAAFLILRWLHDALVRSGVLRRGKRRAFAVRVFDVAWYAFTGVGAVGAGLGVLYLTGDWLLLGLALILLFGLGLAAKNGLPKFYRQARLLLNFGAVREGERLVVNGVPWKVGPISVSTRLDNPAMRGDGLRLPLEQLDGMTSRPHDPAEPWFPCAEDDWALLADGTFGKIIFITPEFVQLVMLGSARKTYPTAGFLATHPQNLSGGFRVTTTLGLDYRHLAIAAREVPERLLAFAQEALVKSMPRENLKRLQVDFRAAGQHSLDFELTGDFAGEAAPYFPGLNRLLNRVALEAAHHHGWTIAFPQLVIRQAEPATESRAAQVADT